MFVLIYSLLIEPEQRPLLVLQGVIIIIIIIYVCTPSEANLNKTKLLFLPGKGISHPSPHYIENYVVSAAWIAKNLGVTLDDQLSFAANIAATTRP